MLKLVFPLIIKNNCKKASVKVSLGKYLLKSGLAMQSYPFKGSKQLDNKGSKQLDNKGSKQLDNARCEVDAIVPFAKL